MIGLVLTVEKRAAVTSKLCKASRDPSEIGLGTPPVSLAWVVRNKKMARTIVMLRRRATVRGDGLGKEVTRPGSALGAGRGGRSAQNTQWSDSVSLRV